MPYSWGHLLATATPPIILCQSKKEKRSKVSFSAGLGVDP
jgi:hypothetical protein